MNLELKLPKSKLSLTIAMAIAAGATVWAVARSQSRNLPETSELAVARPARAVEAIAALGYLEPEGEVVRLSAPAFMEGARVDELLVEQGEWVEADQVVAILDSRNRLQSAVVQAESEVAIAKARLARVEAGAKSGDIQAQEARFEETRAELQGQIATQRATLASLKAQLAGERSAYQATIARLEAELRHAETDCQRYESLYNSGAVSAQSRDSFCLERDTAAERLSEGRANQTRITSTLQEQIREAEANLARTVATLQRQIEQASAQRDAVAEVREVDVEVARAEVGAARASLQRAEAELEQAYVRSPQAGRVLEVETRPGELVEDSIVQIGRTDHMYAVAEVYEADIDRVRVGQQATITAGMMEPLSGTVETVGLRVAQKDVLGTDPVADTDARVVEVKIRLEPEASRRVMGLTNLQINAVIHVDNT